MSFRTRSVTLSDSTVLDMNMITLSSTCMLVWADDVAMLAHDDQRLPLRKCYTVSPDILHTHAAAEQQQL